MPKAAVRPTQIRASPRTPEPQRALTLHCGSPVRWQTARFTDRANNNIERNRYMHHPASDQSPPRSASFRLNRWRTILSRAIAAACALTGLHAAAATSATPQPADTVELPFWTREWSGTVGTKRVEVALTRTGDAVSGSYCYLPCTLDKRNRLTLEGKFDAQRTQLAERDIGARSNPDRATGRWDLSALDETAAGTWHSPDGKRTLPVALSQSHVDKPFPYEIRLVAHGVPSDGRCSDSASVSAIRLYDKSRLVQTLATASVGPCGLFTPEIVDANFDGWPDLMLAQSLGASPNIPYQTWLFDPKTRRFVDAPPKLQDITSPGYDPVHRIIWTSWRASCCDHGVTTYRWQGNDVTEIDTQSSHILPVLDGDTRRYCYVIPEYGDGYIDYPQRIEQTATGLKSTIRDLKGCDIGEPSFLARTHVDIWKPGAAGHAPTIVRTEAVRWKHTQTTDGPRFCPEVPFYDRGRIRRIVLRDDPEQCSETDPGQP
ncbi:XAC2610-related protein [Burkholderia stagnalis]|uniref:XAC2610-related protein n=1 Tax=Burkholderia stagnalis TaxID=1503054 RepID=UPI001E4C96EE|nr:nitrite reductase [Burkholderia stagnalis]